MIKGAGGIVSTLRDLHLWDEALTQRALNDSDWARQYFPGPGDYSFGWLGAVNLKAKMFVHGGEDPGFCAQNMILPDLDAHVIIATNSDYCAFDTDALKPFTRAVIVGWVAVNRVDLLSFISSLRRKLDHEFWSLDAVVGK